ncbi:MAG: diguanylate cyclase [Acidobacteria bacterium]|nr:diguanylate cyclase [Acidobacteriota bacterium]
MPPTVALVEDDPNIRKMLTLHLERAGYAVIAAESMAEGRELLGAGGWQVAMLDRRLPDGDGVELVCETRVKFPHHYILILTGEDSEQSKLEGFNRGADDYVTKPFQIQELLARIRAGVRIVELQQKLLELTVTDGLTGLRNRRAFEKELRGNFDRALRYGRPLSLVILDVDHFKAINDTYGHSAGDAVLKEVARTIAAQTRGTDLTARIGGEEFALLLPETSLFDAIPVAEKIRNAIAAEPVRLGSLEIPLTISAGGASFPHSLVTSAAELFHATDQALYRAKERGRNRIELERRRDRFERLPMTA